MTTPAKSSALRKASLFYLVFVMFSYTTGGPFGLEDMVTTSGPGLTLLYLLVLPFFWCIPVSLVSAELTTAMPVEGGLPQRRTCRRMPRTAMNSDCEVLMNARPEKKNDRSIITR